MFHHESLTMYLIVKMLTLQYDTHNVINMYYTHILYLNYKKMSAI